MSKIGTIKRPKAMEIDYWREEMQRTRKGLIAPAAIFFVQLFMPQRKHVFLPNLVSLFMVSGAMIFTSWALKRTHGYTETKNMYFMNSLVHHTVRTFAHVVYISVDHADMFGRLFFLFVAPCSAARISSYSTFIGFLVVHVALLFYRFLDNFVEESPFLITALACVHILYETSLLKKRGEDNALEKSSTMVTMTEGIAEGVLECFCDATARISPDLAFVQESPSLSTLLSRNVRAGRCFTDFIHVGDRDYFRRFMDEAIKSAEREEEMFMYDPNAAHAIDHVQGLRLRSIDLHLEDAANIPFEAHVFQARLKNLDESPVYLIGISERDSYKHTRKKGGATGNRRQNRMDRTRLDFESGKLIPSTPAFDKKDMALMSRLECYQHQRESMEDVDGSPIGFEKRLRASNVTPYQRGRPGSPRPHDATWKRQLSSDSSIGHCAHIAD